jgi:hypothetical protein
MKKKYIRTSEIKKWKCFEAIGYLFPVAIFAWLYIRFRRACQQADLEYSNLIVNVLLLICAAVMFSIPIILLWRALFRQLKRNAIKRATFKAHLGIDYYREKLEGLSPVEISMLTDIKIEPEKDVSALLLKYQMKGIVKIDEKNVQVLRPDDPSLLPSDKLLLQAVVEHGELSNSLLNHLSEWKSTAFNEVLQGKYFKNDRDKVIKKQSNGCLLGCLSMILIFIIIGVVFSLIINSTPVKYSINLIENMPETANSGVTHMIYTDPNLAMGLMLMLLCVLLLIFAVFWPIAVIIRSTTKVSGMAKIKRTEEGEQMTEYIYAMKNFLHDFSNLSEASKEDLVLWEDFLIYAVVLEENEQILREIFARKSLKWNNIILNTHNKVTNND